MKIHGTAKGGAISKKEFGVAFGDNGVTPSSEISQENYDDEMSLQKDGTDSYGFTFQTDHELIGKTVTSVSFRLKAGYGTITEGTISAYCGQNQSGTSGNVIIGSIDASTLSTDDYEWKEFTGISTPEIEVNDVIWCQYSVEGDQRCKIRYYGNATGGGLNIPANFWGNNTGSLPQSNTLGSTNAGATIINWMLTNAIIGRAPSPDGSPYFHPLAIKINYTE